MADSPTLHRPRRPVQVPDSRQVLSPVSRPMTWRRRGLRYVRRLLFLGLYAAAGFLLYTYIVSPLILGEDEGTTAAPATSAPAPPATTQAPPPRPEGIPARIPQWAWAMHKWHSTPGDERTARPEAAPQRLPAWYWEWREWRIAVEE